MKPTTEELAEYKSRASEWAAERLADSKTVILDLETTGILSKDPNTEICQVAITDTKGRPLFSMLVKPDRPMSEEVQGIHGITNAQVQDQPIFPQVAKFLAFVLEGKHVCCYNADFDWKLMVHMFKKYKQDLPKISGASCAMDRYSEFVGEWNARKEGFKWQKLPQLSGMPSHDAFADCISTLKVMELMASKFDRSKVEAEEIDLDF
jgi:DNA polymerase III epsilon subunit-like protein